VDSILGFGLFASDQTTYLWLIFGGFCGGLLLIAVAIITIFFALRKKKKEIPPSSNEPIPPTI